MGRKPSEIDGTSCPLCTRDVSVGFVETITLASAAVGVEMSPDAFREWLKDEVRPPES